MNILLIIMTLLDGQLHTRYDADNLYAVQSFTDPNAVMRVCITNSHCFGVTRTGQRIDPILAETGDEPGYEWGTQWMAQTVITRKGWFAEMKIPRKLVDYATTLYTRN